MTTIRTRMAKIQTMQLGLQIAGSGGRRAVMKAMSATPVTP